MIQLDLNHAFLKEDVKAYQDQVRAIDEALQKCVKTQKYSLYVVLEDLI